MKDNAVGMGVGKRKKKHDESPGSPERREGGHKKSIRSSTDTSSTVQYSTVQVKKCTGKKAFRIRTPAGGGLWAPWDTHHGLSSATNLLERAEWGVDGEDALDAVALEGLAHGDGGGDPSPVDGDHNPLVRLHTALVALNDNHPHLDGHAHPEGNEVILQLRRVHPLHVLGEALAAAAAVAARVGHGDDRHATLSGNLHGSRGLHTRAHDGGASAGERVSGVSGGAGSGLSRDGKAGHGGRDASHFVFCAFRSVVLRKASFGFLSSAFLFTRD